jgi:hypothetical protein
MITKGIAIHPWRHEHPPRLPGRIQPPLHTRIPRICASRGAVAAAAGAVGTAVDGDAGSCGVADVGAGLGFAGLTSGGAGEERVGEEG